MKTKEKICEAGTKVFGSYYDVPYTGTVESGRPHTLNDSWEHTIRLDKPIRVFGNERDVILVRIWEPNGGTGNTISEVAT